MSKKLINILIDKPLTVKHRQLTALLAVPVVLMITTVENNRWTATTTKTMTDRYPYKHWSSMITTLSSVGFRSLRHHWRLRSAIQLDDNNNDYIDIVDLKKRCIHSIAIVLCGKYESYRMKSVSAGIFIGQPTDRLVVTCSHGIRDSPVATVQHILSYVSQTGTKQISDQIDADVLYNEPHLDLSLIRVRDCNDEVDTSVITTMPFADTSNEFGAQVVSFGHGGSIRYIVLPGIIRSPGMPSNRCQSVIDKLCVYYSDELPSITHSAVMWPGFSGGPLVDTDYRCCGIMWGCIFYKEVNFMAVDYRTVINFIDRGLQYHSQHSDVKRNRLRQQYESDRPADRRLLGFVLQSEIGGLFTVQSLLPNPAKNAHAYVGARIEHVSGQLFRNIDQLTAALNHSLTVQLVIRFEREEDEGEAGHSGQRPRKGSMNHIELTAPDPQTTASLVDRWTTSGPMENPGHITAECVIDADSSE
ncbi:uncharacterized protein LOC128955002 [Oppia nitens]|uniref:uncharacterized protein LOC128955002 n=1 Tax=Oppia nitens TaxID=1686743 RepID=UPI0023DA8C93|nr:uncharacterized protein LOC128955002 [Oppia nitens]